MGRRVAGWFVRRQTARSSRASGLDRVAGSAPGLFRSGAGRARGRLGVDSSAGIAGRGGNASWSGRVVCHVRTGLSVATDSGRRAACRSADRGFGAPSPRSRSRRRGVGGGERPGGPRVGAFRPGAGRPGCRSSGCGVAARAVGAVALRRRGERRPRREFCALDRHRRRGLVEGSPRSFPVGKHAADEPGP